MEYSKKLTEMEQTIEVKKNVQVVGEVDVLIAGGGIAGSVAAVAAGRNDARTMVIERFGSLGGNMGPGMFSGGVVHLSSEYPLAYPEGLKGIPGEFLDRCGAYVTGQLGHNYFGDSQMVSYVWNKMMEENNVEVMLNTFVTGVIKEKNRVCGLIVDNLSGTQAIRAKVVIDATGNADVAWRAGAETCEGYRYPQPGMYFAIGNVNEKKYLNFLENRGEPDPEDLKWLEEVSHQEFGGDRLVTYFKDYLPFCRRAWSLGEYWFVKRIGDLATVSADHGFYPPKHGIVGGQLGYRSPHNEKGRFHIDCADDRVMTALERGGRNYIFETAQFFKKYVPGFERSYLHMISPYFASRGGRSAVCEYTFTSEDLKEGRRLDDVVFVSYGTEIRKTSPEGNDWPYRQFLPKKVEGLLMAGRSSIVQGPVMRTRWKMLMSGQAAGLAASLAVKQSCTPRKIDVRTLQKILYEKYNAYLGDERRLKKLGLV